MGDVQTGLCPGCMEIDWLSSIKTDSVKVDLGIHHFSSLGEAKLYSL